MDWIMSGGGPLICLEERLRAYWAGDDRLTVPCSEDASIKTDYERACSGRGYVKVVPLQTGHALILGDMPLDTGVWHQGGKGTLIVRVFCAEPDFDAEPVLTSLSPELFETPVEMIDFASTWTDFIMFDSAYTGTDTDRPELRFRLPTGRYRILTQRFDPDTKTSLLLHKFVWTGTL